MPPTLPSPPSPTRQRRSSKNDLVQALHRHLRRHLVDEARHPPSPPGRSRSSSRAGPSGACLRRSRPFLRAHAGGEGRVSRGRKGGGGAGRGVGWALAGGRAQERAGKGTRSKGTGARRGQGSATQTCSTVVRRHGPHRGTRTGTGMCCGVFPKGRAGRAVHAPARDSNKSRSVRSAKIVFE